VAVGAHQLLCSEVFLRLTHLRPRAGGGASIVRHRIGRCGIVHPNVFLVIAKFALVHNQGLNKKADKFMPWRRVNKNLIPVVAETKSPERGVYAGL
jgi:hypothetical protein